MCLSSLDRRIILFPDELGHPCFNECDLSRNLGRRIRCIGSTDFPLTGESLHLRAWKNDKELI